ncbi:MAG: hypothetical protein JXR83_23625 [Deltaproteobacteria bacterium]|nr:hypothetical protein [Deltaproteobacteria bacterium]
MHRFALPLLALVAAPALAAEAQPRLTFGQPVPLSRRPVLVRPLGLEVDIRYGLVGSGPTRFINDIRFAPLDWLELRTSLGPYPDSLIARVAVGELSGPGTFSIDGGLVKLDLGLRLNPEEREAVKGIVTGSAGIGVAYDRTLGTVGRLHAKARIQQRYSTDDGLDQTVAMAAVSGDIDFARYFGCSAGLGYGQLIAGRVMDQSVDFDEIGRSGFSTMIDWENDRSATLLLGITYARTESFDVDVFATARYWPDPGMLFGAGLRWRL